MRSTRRPDGLADRRDDVDRGLGLLSRQLLPGRAERVELEAAIAAGDDVAGPLGVLGRRARPAVPAVGVGGQPVVTAAAEQPVDRLAAGLADQVPERDLDPADGGHDRRSALVLVADHPADDRLDVERVAAQHPPLDPLVATASGRSSPATRASPRPRRSGRCRCAGGRTDSSAIRRWPGRSRSRRSSSVVHFVSEPRWDCPATRSRPSIGRGAKMPVLMDQSLVWNDLPATQDARSGVHFKGQVPSGSCGPMDHRILVRSCAACLRTRIPSIPTPIPVAAQSPRIESRANLAAIANGLTRNGGRRRDGPVERGRGHSARSPATSRRKQAIRHGSGSRSWRWPASWR